MTVWTTIELDTDSVLCLYTDGLVERRGIPLDDRFDLLCGAVELEAPESVCAKVMGRLIGADPPNDDVTLLVVRRTEPDASAPLEAPALAPPALMQSPPPRQSRSLPSDSFDSESYQRDKLPDSRSAHSAPSPATRAVH